MRQLILLWVLISSLPVFGESQEFDFKPRTIIPRPLPVITNATFIAGSGASREVVRDNELVLGVVINGQARAYPVNQMASPGNHIVNDTLGGVSIAATWCDLCHNGIVYGTDVAGRSLKFVVSGKLWNRSMVMSDTKTGTLWSQFLGRGMEGELTGTELKVFPSVIADWKSWREGHPNTTVMSIARSAEQYVVEFQRTPNRFVLGVQHNGERKAYPFDLLTKKKVINDKLAGVPIVVTFDGQSTAGRIFERGIGSNTLDFSCSGSRMLDQATQSEWNPETGLCVSGELKGQRLEPMVATVSYSEVWFAFYPSSARYELP